MSESVLVFDHDPADGGRGLREFAPLANSVSRVAVVGLGGGLEVFRVEFPLFSASVFARSRPTPGTVLLVRRDGLVAVPTVLSGRVLGVGALVDDAGLLEDGLVVLGGGDVLVGLPHAGVDLPADAVLDLTSGVPLAAHARDGAVPEVVSVRRSVDAGTVGDALQLVVHRRGSQRAVVVSWLVATPGDLVEQRDVVLIGARVRRPEVVTDGGDGVDQGVLLDVGTLQPDRVRVGFERRRLPVQIDVTDAERPGERSSDASVGEELDQGDVAHVVRAADECLDVLRVEHLLASRRLRVVDADRLVVVTPVVVVVAMNPLEELPDGRLDVLGGGVADAVVAAEAVLRGVPELVDVLVELQFVHGGERAAHPSGRQPEALEVLREGGRLEAAVLLRGKLLDVTAIGVVMPVELLELGSELVFVTGEVVEGHELLQEPPVQKAQAWEKRSLDMLRLSESPIRRGEKDHSTPTSPVELQGYSPAGQGVSA